MIDKILEGLGNAALMTYQVFWALVLGFLISAIVQAWVPQESIRRGMAGRGFGPVAKATGLGAASSSCSYAAVSIGRSLFAKGASVEEGGEMGGESSSAPGASASRRWPPGRRSPATSWRTGGCSTRRS